MEQNKLIAREGYVLTNGDIYGKVIYPSNNLDLNSFYEITEREYNKILEKELNDGNNFNS